MAKRQGIMLCYPFEGERLAKWNSPTIVQPKLDGERCRALYNPEHTVDLISSELNYFNSIPEIEREVAHLMNHLQLSELDGELYRHGWPFEEIHSVVSASRVSLHPDHSAMEYHIFDVPLEGVPQYERTRLLQRVRECVHSLGLEKVRVVPSYCVEGYDAVIERYRDFISRGFEGIIVRHIDGTYVRRRSTYIMKFKPKRKDDYEILEFVEAHDKHGQPKGMLGAVWARGDDGTPFKLGAGTLRHDERTAAWINRDAYRGGIVTAQYQHKTSLRGVPRHGFVLKLELTKFQGVRDVNPLLSF